MIISGIIDEFDRKLNIWGVYDEKMRVQIEIISIVDIDNDNV